MKELENALYFTGPEDWREWLTANHDKSTEAWLIYYKKGSGKSSITYGTALDEAICFGWIDGKIKSLDEEKYMQRYSPRRPKSPWSKINKDKAESLIEAGRMTESGLVKIEEARKNGLWDAAYSNTNRVMEEIPADLETALSQDEAARTNFHNFANSYRNNYIGWLNSAKTAPTREKRISEIVKRSSLNEKPGMV